MGRTIHSSIKVFPAATAPPLAPSSDDSQSQSQDLGASRYFVVRHNPTMQRGFTDSRISNCRIENVGLEAEYGGGIRLAWGSERNCVEDNAICGTGAVVFSEIIRPNW